MTNRFFYDPEREKINAAKALALEALLIEKGIITADSVDKVIKKYLTKLNI